MANGRREDQWNHTAAVLAMQVNTAANRKRSVRAKPADFHPFTNRGSRRLSRQESKQALARFFNVEISDDGGNRTDDHDARESMELDRR